MFFVLCLSALVAGTQAIVCTPEICAASKCAALTAENCAGTIKPNGGFCGCCDACITELAEGDSCFSLMLFGVPSTTQCAEGLFCDQISHTCKRAPVKRELGPCGQALQDYNARMEASQHMLMGLEKPRCDADGNYLGMQFSGSQAYCVTKDGTPIDSYMVNRWETGDDMNCQCARDLYDYMQSGLIGKLFYCQPNGNYPPPTTTSAPVL